ncbi:MAG: hypothetical protein E7259_04290 [Lachnospiraceae bacterium]|nr:hypothetical protein [Lachnospiraceae bacterium]
MNPYVEKQIDLKQYFISLIRCWWLGVLVAVLCGMALATFIYVKDKNDNNRLREELYLEAQAEDDELNVDEIKATLDAVELQNVELAVEYYRMIKQYAKYEENSIYMAQNPYKVDKTIITYMISLDVVEDLSFEGQQVIKDNIVSCLVNYVNNGGFSDVVEKYTGVEARYINELVSASKNGSDSYSLDTFDIYIINDDDLGDISEYVKSGLENYGAEINGVYGTFSIKTVEEYSLVEIDNSMVNAIESVQTDIYNATTRLNTVMKNFSEEQLICYNDAIGAVDLMVSEEEEAGEDNLSTPVITPAKFSVKYAVVGFILGLVLYCGLVLVWFMFTSKVLAVSGFESMFGVKLFGVLLPESMYGKKTSLLRKIEYGDLKSVGYSTVIGLLAIKVKAACKGINKLAVISSDFDSINEDIYTSLKERLSSEGIELVEIKKALSDGKDLEKMISIGNCIALEKAGSTKIKTFAMMKELCDECDVKLHGVINVN